MSPNASLVGITDAAVRLGVSARRIQILAKSGRIPGAQKIGGAWVLPADFKVKPAARARRMDKISD
jgi:hypothetical protein